MRKKSLFIIFLCHFLKISAENKIQMYNQIPYRMTSLESIYLLKKGSRLKDKYDVETMKDSVNMSVVKTMEILQAANYRIDHRKVENHLFSNLTNKLKMTHYINI